MIYVVTDDLRRSNISGSVGEGLFGQYVPDKIPEKIWRGLWFVIEEPNGWQI